MNIEKKKNFIINTVYAALILLFVFIVIQFGFGLIAPFIIAFLIAYLLRKPILWITKKTKLPYRLISIFMVILFYSTIGLLILFVLIRIGLSISSVLAYLPTLYNTSISPLLSELFSALEVIFEKMDPQLMSTVNSFFTQSIKAIGDLLSTVSLSTISAISSYATSLPELFIRILFTIISTFFIVLDYDQIIAFGKRQLTEKTSNLILHIKDYIVGTLFVCIRSYALIMFLTFIELSIGLSLIQVNNAIGIALLISIFDILPVLGTGGIMIPWMILSAFQGNTSLALGLLVVYLAITVIRNILEPKIVGQQIGLHPVVTLISMFAGAKLFGILGLFGLPITLSLLKHLNDDGTIKIFK